MVATVIASRTTNLFNDADGDGKATPGDTLISHILLNNNTAAPIANVSITDTFLSHTSFVAGTVVLTVGDSYGGIVGNTPISYTAGQGLLANDKHIDGANAGSNTGLTVVNVNGTGIGGAITIHDAANNAINAGTVNVAADGSFSFTPASGYLGTAAFTYQTSDGSGIVGTGTVNLNVTSEVWYVDGNASAVGADGTYLHPYTDFSQLNGAGDKDNPGDTIFVKNYASGYTVNLALEAGEKLFGDGHAFVVNGTTISTGASTSTLTATSGIVVTANTDNDIQGITLNANGAGAVGLANSGASSVSSAGALTSTHLNFTGTGEAIKIIGGGAVNLSVDSLTSSGSSGNAVQLAGTAASLLTGTVGITAGAISGATGAGFLLGVAGGGTASSGGNANVTYGGTISSGTGSAVEIQDRTGGTATFSGNITHSGTTATGILLDGNSGTVNFNAQTSITNSGTGAGVQVTNNAATVNFAPTGNGLDISTSSGTGLTVNGGTLNVTGAGNTITTATGQIVSMTGTTIGGSNAQFASLQATGTVAGTAIGFNNVDGGTFTGTSVNVSGHTGDAVNISGGSTTSFTFGDTTIGAGGGKGIDVTGNAAANVTFNNNLNISTAAQNAIDIVGNGGTISFTGGTKTIAATTGSGINIDNNSATIGFTNGGINLDTTTGTGLTALKGTGSGGTLQIAGTSNSIQTTSGQAININGVVSNGITLHDVGVSAAGGTNDGISLVNAGSGGFTITGTGTTAASGGTINGKNGADGNDTQGIGIYVNNTNNISLSNMAFTGTFQNYGIRGITVNNFLLQDSTMAGTYGTTNAGANLEGNIRFAELTGAGTFKGDVIAGAYNDNVYIENTANSTLNLTFEDSAANQAKFNGNSSTTGNNAITVITHNDANLFMLVNGVDFTDWRVTGIVTRALDTSNHELTFQNNTFFNTNAGIISTGGGAIDIGGTGNGASWGVDYSIINNQAKGAKGGPVIAAQFVGTSGTARGFISGNTIGTPGVGTGGASDGTGTSVNGLGISVSTEQDVGVTGNNILANYVTIQNNVIADINGSAGIRIRAANGTSATAHALVEATVTGNSVKEMGSAGVFAALYTIAGGNDPDFGQVGLDVRNNTFDISSPSIPANKAYAPVFMDQIFGTSSYYYLPGYAGSVSGEDYGGTASTDVATYLQNGAHLNSLINTSAPLTGDPTQKVFAPDAKVQAGALQTAQTGSNTQLPPAAAQVNAQGAPGDAVIGDKPLGDPVVVNNPDPNAPQTPPDDGTPPPPPPPSTPIVTDGILTQAEVNFLVDAAIARWAAAGATPEQLAVMKSATFTIADMAGLEAGTSEGHTITLDDNGAGYGWFLDSTPGDDAEFSGSGTRLLANDGSGAAGHLDLLTVIMHELGHQAGLADDYNLNDSADLMYGYMNPGERRLPAQGESAGATPGAVGHEAFALTPVALGTVPIATSYDVSFRQSVDNFSAGLAPSLTGTSTVTYDPAQTKTATDTISATQETRTDSGGTVTTSSLAVATLTLGDLVYQDVNKNGIFDAGDTGIGNVTVKLYIDNGTTPGAWDASDTLVTTTTTSNVAGTLGQYSFTGLAPGDYIVVIPSSSFNSGQPLHGLVAHTGAGDPDDNVDNDNNGIAQGSGDVASLPITLSYDNEPTAGPGNDTNNTLDFGFQSNSPPVANTDTATVDEDSGANTVNVRANDSDPDGDAFTVTGVTNGSHGTVAITNSGADLSYTPAANYNGSDSFTYTITDSHGATATATVNVTVNAVNDPVHTAAPATFSLNEDAGSTAVGGLSISDVDATLAPSGVYVVQLTSTHGTIALTTSTGLTFDNGSASGVTAMTFHGTLADINTALASLHYTPDANYNGSAQISIAATDQFGGVVATGSGAATNDAQNITVTVNPMNDPPVVPDSPTIGATEQTPVTINPALTVSDIDLDARNGGNGDYGGATFTASRSGGANAQDQFILETSNAVGFTVTGTILGGGNLQAGGLTFGDWAWDGAGNLTIHFTSAQTPATTALVNHVLQAIEYNNTSDTPPASVTLNYALDDGAPGGGQGTVVAGNNVDGGQVTINITPTNDAPWLDLNGAAAGTDTVINYTENDPATPLAPSATIADPDSPDFDTGKLTVQFMSASGLAEDRLIIVNQGSGAGQIGVSGSNVTYGGVTIGTFTGGTDGSTPLVITFNANASQAAVTALVHDIGYFNVSDTPSAADRQIGFDVTDGDGGQSNLASSTVHVTPVDDPTVANADTATTDEAHTINIDVLANDTDVDSAKSGVAKVDGQAISAGQTVTIASGAKVTLNNDGTLTYDPNGKFNHLTNPSSGESGAANTSAIDSFSYTNGNNNSANVTVTVNGLASPDDWLAGDSGDNNITGTVNGDFFMLQQGGNDTATGLGGNDAFYFGAALTAADHVDGGAGNDIVALQGDYSSGLVLGAQNLVNIETLSLLTHSDNRFGGGSASLFSYNLTTVDANVGSSRVDLQACKLEYSIVSPK